MKIILAAGSTGGHIFPALKVKDVLEQRGHEVIFFGLKYSKVESIKAEEKVFKNINPKPLSLKNPLSLFVSTFSNIIALSKAIKALKEIGPDAVLGFGSYSSFPVVLGAAISKISTMIHEQNVVPGKANIFLSKFVNKIAVSFKESNQYFPEKKLIYTGCPCNGPSKDYKKDEILKEFNFSPDKKSILIFGGSQGSHNINEHFVKAIVALKNKIDIQVIHISGKNDYEQIKKEYIKNNIKFVLFDFYNEIEKAYFISDLVICRAGAVSITEIAAYGLPAILVPYPHASGHQEKNANVLKNIDNVSIIKDKQLNPDIFVKEILSKINTKCTGNSKQLLDSIFIRDSAVRIADNLERLINDHEN